MSPLDGVFFASEDDTFFVLDIPTTIAAAQGTADYCWNKMLISRDPLTEPLPSLEPKSVKAKEKLLARGQGTVDANDAERVRVIRESLKWLKREYEGPLALPRATKEDKTQGSSDMTHNGEIVAQTIDTLSLTLSSLIQHSNQFTTTSSSSQFTYSHDLKSWLPWTASFSNANPYFLPLHVRTPSSTLPLTFHLPPCSSFLLTTLPPKTPSLAPTPLNGFDLVLLDPPWPNRSVKRSGHYTGPRSLEDTRDLLSDLNLSAHMTDDDDAVIAVWVTNSASVRDIVCGEGGWLDDLGFVATEEWIWVKVTTTGEPILELEGLWRKPYEVLVIARRMQDDEPEAVKRRVLVAVPDVHSRKPSVKQLLERYIVPKSYQALEIFARNLTAGWHSWGNETILYNWERHWVFKDEQADGMEM
jgi:N6-adenosine-specific RNA methylase IME4